jgi:SRSO17 transposase
VRAWCQAFQTKPVLARLMLQRALEAGVPAGWVTADEADGGSPALRGWLEARQLPYVLAVKGHRAAAACVRAGQAGGPSPGRIPPHCWLRISAGHGAKGRR